MNQDHLSALEPGQLRAEQVALPRRDLSSASRFLLVALRIYVVLAVPLVIYAFVNKLLNP
jgi:hypothetical protein